MKREREIAACSSVSGSKLFPHTSTTVHSRTISQLYELHTGAGGAMRGVRPTPVTFSFKVEFLFIRTYLYKVFKSVSVFSYTLIFQTF